MITRIRIGFPASTGTAEVIAEGGSAATESAASIGLRAAAPEQQHRGAHQRREEERPKVQLTTSHCKHWQNKLSQLSQVCVLLPGRHRGREVVGVQLQTEEEEEEVAVESNCDGHIA